MSRVRRLSVAATLLGLVGGLAGCTPTVTGGDFAAVEQRLLQDGRHRTDRAPTDVPFGNDDLIRNFELTAFGLEPGMNDDPTRDLLTRWSMPVRWRVYADGRDAEARQLVEDASAVLRRLSRVTGVDIAPASATEDVNMFVVLLDRRDYDTVAAAPEAAAVVVEEMMKFRTSGNPCIGQIFWMPRRIRIGSIRLAVVMIRSGLSDAFRRVCAEEELAQAMGLLNDDDVVRPSIFNDDQEFALLTEHDEFLLRILYHPRLRPGMAPSETLALVPGIVEELRPGG